MTDSVAVEVLDTDRGRPSQVLTGLATVDLDDIVVRESVVGPDDRREVADEVLLSGGLPGYGRLRAAGGDVVCFGEGSRDPEGGAVLSRRFTAAGGEDVRRDRHGGGLAVGRDDPRAGGAGGVRADEQQPEQGGVGPPRSARRR